MFDQLEGIQDAFSFGLSDRGGSGSDNSHGGWLIVGKAFVGRLDPVGVVFDRLLGFLIEIGEVGAVGLSGVLGLVGLQEFGLDDMTTLMHEGERAFRSIVQCLFQCREWQIFKCCDELYKLNLKSKCCLLFFFLENFVVIMVNLAIQTSFFYCSLTQNRMTNFFIGPKV